MGQGRSLRHLGAGGRERGVQAAGAGGLASPLPVPCETAGNGVLAYSSCDGPVNRCFATAYLPAPALLPQKLEKGQQMEGELVGR